MEGVSFRWLAGGVIGQGVAVGWYQQIISGQRKGPTAAFLRTVFHAVSVVYGSAVRYRNWRFDTGRAKVYQLPVPVISVGNLSLGGTGKTPMTAWLAQWFLHRGVRVGVVSRGYKARKGRRSDEGLELQWQIPGLVHIENPDRVRAGREAVEKFSCQLLVADDAFQHRRLGRDLDIVLIDAVEPFGYGYLFPRGLLREPIQSIKRADALVLSRADMVEGPTRTQLRTQLHSLAPQAVWAEAVHRTVELVNAAKEKIAIDSLAGKPVAAFCGIGQPASFRHSLEQCGYQVVAFRELPDHYPYRPHQLLRLAEWLSQWKVTAVVCTLKDLMKIPYPHVAGKPLWALRVGLELIEGKSQVEALLEEVLVKRGLSS